MPSPKGFRGPRGPRPPKRRFTPKVKLNRRRFGTGRVGITPRPSKGQHVCPSSMSYSKCYSYLKSNTNGAIEVDQLFSFMDASAYTGLQNGSITVDNLLNNVDDSGPLRICWGDCGHGIGSCASGTWCCGHVGKGLGCGYNFTA